MYIVHIYKSLLFLFMKKEKEFKKQAANRQSALPIY